MQNSYIERELLERVPSQCLVARPGSALSPVETVEKCRCVARTAAFLVLEISERADGAYNADMGEFESLPFPIVTGTQMAAVDRAMVEVCGLELIQVMETAGRAVAIVARSYWRRQKLSSPIVILCGSGGNGGDGLVCGRYLHGWGIPVELWLMRPAAELRGLAGHQLEVCRRIGMTIIEPDRAPNFAGAGLIIDGLFGFGLSAAPAGAAAAMIDAANATSVPILAIDIPSGIDSTTGAALGAAVAADLTVTLGLPKQGLLQSGGVDHTGDVIVADIGIPRAAYTAVGIPTTRCFQDAEFTDLHGLPWSPE